jgi:acetylornithine deacetylase
MDGRQERIVAAAEAFFGSQVAFLSELVRHALLRGGKKAVQAELNARGYEIDHLRTDAARIDRHPAFSPATIDYTES